MRLANLPFKTDAIYEEKGGWGVNGGSHITRFQPPCAVGSTNVTYNFWRNIFQILMLPRDCMKEITL